MESPESWESKMKRWVFWLILVPLFAWFGRDGGNWNQWRVFGDKPPFASWGNLK
jgi:hypothetical protein